MAIIEVQYTTVHTVYCTVEGAKKMREKSVAIDDDVAIIK
jgi:hypothetical protein